MDDTLNLKDCIGDVLSEDTDKPRIKQLYTALIKHAIIISDGNRTRAAEYAGISIRTLRNHVRANPELRELLNKYDNKQVIFDGEEKIKVDLEPEIREASKGLIRRAIKRIYKATQVYHIREIFNNQRPLFVNERVQRAAFKNLEKFDKEICSLMRFSAAELREDIEIFIETGCKIKQGHKYDSQGNFYNTFSNY